MTTIYVLTALVAVLLCLKHLRELRVMSDTFLKLPAAEASEYRKAMESYFKHRKLLKRIIELFSGKPIKKKEDSG